MRDSNHECRMLDESEHLQYYDRSKLRWDLKRNQVGDVYKEEHHAKWCDKNNIGVTHFGIHPHQLNRNKIRMDTFHLKCAVTRNLMTELRKFMNNQSIELIDEFKSQVLSKFWNNFHVYVWNSGKELLSFQGNYIVVSLASIPKVVEFLEKKIIMTEYLQDLKRALLI